MKQNSMANRLRRVDEAACDGILRLLGGGVGRRGMRLFAVAAALFGALCAGRMGGCGLGECALCGVLALMAALALLRGEAMPVLDALVSLGVMMLLFAARVRMLPVISPDCQDYLLLWADVMEGLSFGEVMGRTVGDYTVIYQYIVFMISRIPLDRVVMYKAVSMAFEPLLAWGVASLVCRARGLAKSSATYRAAFIVTLGVPTVLVNSSMWAQCDAIYAALVLSGVVLAMQERPCLASACFALSLCFKLQAIFLLPAVAVLLALRRLSLRHVLLMGVVFALVGAPAALMGKGIKGVLSVYLYQMKEYDHLLTLSAPSVFALFDDLEMVGADRAASAGIRLAMAVCLAAVGLGASAAIGGNARRTASGEAAVMSDVLFALAVGVPFFLPYMHERYFFCADVLAVAFAMTHRRGWIAAACVVLASANAYLDCLFKTPLFTMKMGAALMAVAFGAALMALYANARAQRERGRIDRIQGE